MADLGAGDNRGQHAPNPGGRGSAVLAGRRPSAAISPGRLPSVRSRDLTLGGVKKVTSWVTSGVDSHQDRTCGNQCFALQKTFTPNIIGRKVKEE